MRSARQKHFSRAASRSSVWNVLSALVILVTLSVFFGCGRKGTPKPPEEGAPQPVQYLTAKGEVGAVVLSWTAPEEDASGDKLKNLDAFIVRKAEVVAGKPESADRIARVDAADAVTPSAAAAPASAPAPAAGAPRKTLKQYTFRDPSVQVGKTYEYTVAPVNTDRIEGIFDHTLRVKFSGESSTVENIGVASDRPKLK